MFDSPNRTARVAGLLYLVEIVTGIFSLIYVPLQIKVHGDAVATLKNLVSHEFLFRIDVLVGSFSGIVALVLPFVLYKLLSPVSKYAAVLMVVFGVVFIPIGFVATGYQLDILSLLTDDNLRHAFTSDQIGAQIALLFTTIHDNTLVSEIFWGLWLIPFGYLVFKSGFLPKFLGVFLMLGSLSYLVPVVVEVLFPGYSVPTTVALPSAIGEIGTAFWLAFVGVGKQARR